MKELTLYHKTKHNAWANINTFYAYLVLGGNAEFLEEVSRLKSINALSFEVYLRLASDYNTSEVESDNPKDIDWVNLYKFHLETK